MEKVSPVSANRKSINNTTNSGTNSLLRGSKSSLNSSREDLLSNASHDSYEAPSLPPKPGTFLGKIFSQFPGQLFILRIKSKRRVFV